MALIKCPECSTEISDQAASCPKCGYPMRAAATAGSDLALLIKEMAMREGKIAAIKLYREKSPGMGLAEAKDYVDQITAGSSAGKGAKSGCMGMLLGGLLFLVVVLVTWGVSMDISSMR